MWSLYRKSFKIIQKKAKPVREIKMFSIELSIFFETIGNVDVVIIRIDLMSLNLCGQEFLNRYFQKYKICFHQQ